MEPKISSITEEGNQYKFTLSGLNVSLANALRRTMLSEIPCNVFRTENYQDNQCTFTKNTSRLHNEILKQRLSCIPIHMKLNELNILPNNYLLEVDVKNDTESMMYVTTEHFKIRFKNDSKTDKYLSREETMKIFPPNKKTNYYIDFARLQPKISDTIPGEELKFTAEFSISNAKTNSMFNVVSSCAYGNTVDKERVEEEWTKRNEKLVKADMSKSDIEFQKRNFYLLDAQRYFVENSFDFVVESVGIYENKEIVKMAAKILVEKMEKFINEIDSSLVKILNSETTMPYSYDIYLEDEDYTMGKSLEYFLYSKYYEDEKLLSFCGFKKFHPHDTHSVIRIAFNENADKSMAQQCLHTASNDARNVFKKLYDIV